MQLPITAAQARESEHQHPKRVELTRIFNHLVSTAIGREERSVNLPFDQFGYHHDDIEWIQKLGYQLDRNSACLWWTVTWKDPNDHQDARAS